MFKEAINKYLHAHGYESIDLKAVLFDMDGVLFDSLPNHAEAWHKIMKLFGFGLSREAVSYTHLDVYKRQNITDILITYYFSPTISSIFLHKEENSSSLYKRVSITIFPDVYKRQGQYPVHITIHHSVWHIVSK